MKKTFAAAFVVAMVLGFCFMQGQTSAQEKPFPTRQLAYLVCFDPGGQSDRGARLYQPHLDKVLGQKVIIDYKVGGGGALGWRELAPPSPTAAPLPASTSLTLFSSPCSRTWDIRRSRLCRS
jgi:tripartite-type tricarboxylate transporter receptor subunit TctC